MSISTKFGHSMSKGSRDTRGGPRRPPPVSGKDFLMPCGIGLKELCNRVKKVELNRNSVLRGKMRKGDFF